MSPARYMNSLVALICALSILLLAPASVLAQQSALRQQLLEPDCSESADACEMAKPSIEKITINDNRPVISGTYDAAFSRHLRVALGGRYYTFSVDDQLTAHGNVWVLDLQSLSQPLMPGAYELIVESEGFDSSIRRVSVIIVMNNENIQRIDSKGLTSPVIIQTPKDEKVETPELPRAEPPTGEDKEAIPQPMDPQEVRARISLMPLIATVATTVGLFGAGWVASTISRKK